MPESNMYDHDYFTRFFQSRKHWRVGTIGRGGNHCALGHMGFKMEDDANGNKRAEALTKIILDAYPPTYFDNDKSPANVIPILNDMVGRDGQKFKGEGPQKRILNAIKISKKKQLAREEIKKTKAVIKTADKVISKSKTVADYLKEASEVSKTKTKAKQLLKN